MIEAGARAARAPTPSFPAAKLQYLCSVFSQMFFFEVCWFVFSHHVCWRERAQRALRSQGAHMQRPPIDFEEHVHLARSSGAIIINKLESQAAQLEQARTMLWPWLHAPASAPPSHFEQEILALEQQLWRLRSDKAREALRDSDEPNYLNSPKRAAAPTVQRSYSAQSQMAIDDLAVVSDEAARLQRTSEQAEVQLRLAERFGEPVDPALRNQLGQLYGDATKLVERGLDGINTADLVSGQQRSTVQKCGGRS